MTPMEEALRILAFCSNILSFLSTILVFYLFHVSGRYKIFEFRLILYLQIADFIVAISYILTIFVDDSEQELLCQMHSFLENCGNLSSVFFTITISTFLHLILRYNYHKSSRCCECLIIFFNYGLPMFMNIMYHIMYLI